MAIKTAIDKVIMYKLKKITIFSDSLSAIEGILSYYSKNPVVLEIQAALHKFGCLCTFLVKSGEISHQLNNL